LSLIIRQRPTPISELNGQDRIIQQDAQRQCAEIPFSIGMFCDVVYRFGQYNLYVIPP
jgi:hypothetical protein